MEGDEMKLSELANISIGSVLSRIPKAEKAEKVLLPLTIQDINYHYCFGEKQDMRFPVSISDSLSKQLVIAHRFDIVISLANAKAMVIEDEYDGYLIPSNMILVNIKDKGILDPFYLAWLINFSTSAQKSLQKNFQGSAMVKSISVDTLRDLDIPILDISKQTLIGRTNELFWRKKRIQKAIIEEEENVVMHLLDEAINNKENK